ncbi:MAG TPA: acyl carrier protein [Motilibacteraceae bacterium]|nr:acyl carrier protein [Motilibacteraceae bacterium]
MPVPPERLREVVAAHLEVEPAALTDEVLLGEELYVDSLAAAELLVVVEDAFEVRLPEDLFADVETYGQLAAAVQSRAVPAA